MKKKLLIILPILIFSIIFFIQNRTYATTYSKKHIEYTLPNKFEGVVMRDDPDDFHIEYVDYNFEGISSEFQIEFKYWNTIYSELGVPNEENLQRLINNLKSNVAIPLYGEPAGTIIELNGVPAYQIDFYTTPTNGELMSHRQIGISTDFAECGIQIQGAGDYAFTDEAINMMNSVKIKDTVTNYKGIPFTDVSKNAWYYSAVKYMYNNNIISGLNSYTFAPNQNLTRGMIVTILWRMEGSPANDGKSKFTDVSSEKWYSQAIKWAAANKIINGYSGTTKFGPEDNILRQDLAGILKNYANYKGKNTNVIANLTGFKDYKQISSYAKASMEWAVGKKVITGNATTKTLNPKGNATRAEAASMIMKYCDNVGK